MKIHSFLLMMAIALFAGASISIGQAATDDVTISDNAFTPNSIPISQGTTVTWKNAGADSHSVTSDDGSFDSSPTCTSAVTTGCIPPGGAYPHTFPSVGSFAYRCRRHPSMRGTVVVTAATVPSPSPSGPPPSPPPPAPSPSPSPKLSPIASPSPAPSPTPRAPSPSPSSGEVVTGSVTIDQTGKGGAPVGRIIAIVAGVVLAGSAIGLWLLRKTPA